MNILIAGASGFIGQKLVAALQEHHQITVLGRDSARLKPMVTKNVTVLTWDSLPDTSANSYEVVINLCGYNIAASRWTEAVKAKIISSRVKTTEALVTWLNKQQAKPQLICANAVGIYGMQAQTDRMVLDEDSVIDFEHPVDFMSEIGIRWQQALQPAIDQGLHVITTRFGVVLGKNQGMLKKLTPSFYLGLGSIIGNGQQTLSWIHIDDVVGALQFLIKHPDQSGAFNLTAPNPVTQAEFAQSLAHAMHRPLFLTIPAVVIRWLLGEMGDCLLLNGQRVVPTRLLTLGYQFQYPDLAQALRHEYPE